MKDGNIIDFQKALDKQKVEEVFYEQTEEEFDAMVREMLKKDFRPRLSLSERLFMLTALTAMLGGTALLVLAGVLSLM